MIYLIDLFCGFGGVTFGIEQVRINGKKPCTVVACVNHDALAIESHKRNHPDALHLIEDIRNPVVIEKLKVLVDRIRRDDPTAEIHIWASLECTHFSNAKGGESRNPDSRTLAEFLPNYVTALNPDHVWIENVKEFRSWGPLTPKVEWKNRRRKDPEERFVGSFSPVKYDKKKKQFHPHWIPESKEKGKDYLRWVNSMCDLGYDYDHQILCCANYGDPTIRVRYFGQFCRKSTFAIHWPEQTHSKNPVEGGLFKPLKKWVPVRECLDLEEHGESIFDRDKDLVDRTLERIYHGLIKFVAKGDDSFLHLYYSGEPHKKVKSLDAPSPTVTGFGNLGTVKVAFLNQAYGGDPKHQHRSLDAPAPTITTVPHEHLVVPAFIQKYNSNNAKTLTNKGASLDDPCHTITCQPRMTVVHTENLFIHKYKTGQKGTSLDDPAHTLTSQFGQTPVSGDFLVQYNGKPGYYEHSLDKPCGTLTTKDRFFKVQWLPMQYKGENNNSSVDDPAWSLTTNPKHHIATAIPWVMNTQFDNKGGSVDEPSHTLIARMDKKPQYLVQGTFGEEAQGPSFLAYSPNGHPVGVIVHESDSEPLKKIKYFMAHYGLIDIKMRQLFIKEMLRITSLPDDYAMAGNKNQHKKFIGNSVPTKTVSAMFQAYCDARLKALKIAV